MELDYKALVCKACNAPLRAPDELRVGMVLACDHCDVRHVVCEEGLKLSQDASPKSANESWRQQDNEGIRTKRAREREAGHRFSVLMAKVDCALLAFTLIVGIVQTSAGVASTCTVLLCAEIVGLIAILCGVFEKKNGLRLASDEAQAPISSKQARGMDYEDVVAAFHEAGFEDIRPMGLDDLGFLRRHLCSSENRVESIRIGNKSDFEANAIFIKSDVVSVRYHSAKESLITRLMCA